MPFVKVDCGVLRSSLWIDRDRRSLFFTALFMAEPFELLEPTPQIEVRTLDETGFIVPPGWYGMIKAAGAGIVRQDGMDREAGLNELEILGSPDPESRSPEYEGRRVVRIAGGYVVLNYMKYRDYDHTAAERQRRLRDRRRGAAAAETESGVEDFERAWSLYPKRGGGNSKAAALKAWNARVRQGVPPAEMIAGVERYAAYIRAKNDEGTEYVKQAATFFGPSAHWGELWVAPAPRGNSRGSKADSEIGRFLDGE